MQDNLTNLENRVDDLIRLCRQLRNDNESLRADNEAKLQNQTQLTEKNRIARDRLEKIVGRLRELEKTAK